MSKQHSPTRSAAHEVPIDSSLSLSLVSALTGNVRGDGGPGPCWAGGRGIVSPAVLLCGWKDARPVFIFLTHSYHTQDETHTTGLASNQSITRCLSLSFLSDVGQQCSHIFLWLASMACCALCVICRTMYDVRTSRLTPWQQLLFGMLLGICRRMSRQHLRQPCVAGKV